MDIRNYMEKNRGFTLLEMLIVMAIIGILASVVMVVINPGRQLAKARDTQRRSDLFAILAAVYQYSTEHNGSLPDTDGDPETESFPTSPVCIGTSGSCFDLANAGDDETIVPDYMAQIPYDPTEGDSSDTKYLIYVDVNDRLVASASGEVDETISVTR